MIHPAQTKRFGRLIAIGDGVLFPLVVFALFYIATFMLLRYGGFAWNQWSGLISVTVATAGSLAVIDRKAIDIGLGGPPFRAIGESVAGLLAGGALIALVDAALSLSGSLVRERPGVFPWVELLAVFVPAAIHEELLFRGYAYRKVRTLGRVTAILLTSVAFAALHGANTGIGALPLLNLFLGGVMLAEVLELRLRLWAPIGFHLGWNVATGPVLGYAVSGYVAGQSLWSTAVIAPWPMSGGAFGLEGSIFVTAAEVLAIVTLELLNRRRH